MDVRDWRELFEEMDLNQLNIARRAMEKEIKSKTTSFMVTLLQGDVVKWWSPKRGQYDRGKVKKINPKTVVVEQINTGQEWKVSTQLILPGD